MAPTEDSSNRERARPWAGGRDRPRGPVGVQPAAPATTSCDWTTAAQSPPRVRPPEPPRRAAAPRADAAAAAGPPRSPHARCRGQRRAGGAAPRGGGRRGGAAAASGSSAKSSKKKVLLWTGGTLALRAGRRRRRLPLLQHFNGNINKVDVGDAGNGGFKKDQAGQHPRHRHRHPQGQGQRGLRRHGQRRPRRHHVPLPRLQGPHQRHRAVHPARHDHRHPRLPDQAAGRLTKNIPGEQDVRFNTSLGQAGRDPGCTMRTVKKLTGIKVNHFMMADFNAVKTLSTAVGGVEVCLAKDINDPKSHLKLTAGKHTSRASRRWRSYGPGTRRLRQRPRPDQTPAAVPQLDDPQDEVRARR